MADAKGDNKFAEPSPKAGTKYVELQTPKGDKELEITPDAEPEQKFSFLSLYRYGNLWDGVLIATGLLMSIINGATFPFMAILFGDALNNFSTNDQDAVNKTALEFGALAIVLLISGYGSYAAFAISAERQMRSLRREVLKHIVYQDMAWYDGRDASELASRISGDTVKIKEGMGEKLGEAFRFIFQFLAGYAIGFYKGWNLSLAMCAVMPMCAVSLTWLIKRLRESTQRSQEVYAAAGAVAEETIGAMRTVASLNGEPRAIEKYSDNVAKAEVETLNLAKFVSFSIGWFFMSMWLTYAIGLWYGGYLVKNQGGTVNSPGDVFSAFYGILMGTMSLAQISPNI
ncbi:ATP-binding Cassette (ABC) Superfamily, partial [Achlya hypogyna]